MRVAIYDRVEPALPAQLPLRIEASCSHRTAALCLVLAVPAALGVLLGTGTLLVHALGGPTGRTLLAQHPGLGIEILAALAMLAGLVVFPLRRLINRLAMKRRLEIAGGMVRVIERGHFKAWRWTVPLSSYTGLAHHVRASLSGTRHELILVHPDREKSLLLAVSQSLSQQEVDRVATILGHKEVPAGMLYRIAIPNHGLLPRSWRAVHA
jgi:hypothetical protein